MERRVSEIGRATNGAESSGAATCGNCGEPLVGEYCSRCGQEARDLDRSIKHLVRELADGVFDLDSRVWRTVVPLVTRPGSVTARYLSGERARFVPPFRLYLLASLVYFLLAAWMGVGGVIEMNVGAADDEDAPSAAEILREEAPDAPAFVDALMSRLEVAARDPEGFRRSVLQGASYLMFVFMPLFGGMLHLSYRGRRRYYLHHLVFAVHFHIVAFFVLTVGMLLGRTGIGLLEGLSELVPLVLLVYLFLSLRRVYGGRTWATALRTVALGSAYGLAVALGTAGLVLMLLFA